MTADASRSYLGLRTCVGLAIRQIVDARVLPTANRCRGGIGWPARRGAGVRPDREHSDGSCGGGAANHARYGAGAPANHPTRSFRARLGVRLRLGTRLSGATPVTPL